MSLGRWTVLGTHIARCQAEVRHAPSTIHRTPSCRLDNALLCTRMPPQLQGLRQSGTWDRHGSCRGAGAWLATTVYRHRLRMLQRPCPSLQ